MIDAQQLHYYYDRLWVYFVDHHLLGQPALILLGVLLLMGSEVIFRDWDQTAMYRLFVRRSTSAKIDIVYYLVQYAGIHVLFRALRGVIAAVAVQELIDGLCGVDAVGEDLGLALQVLLELPRLRCAVIALRRSRCGHGDQASSCVMHC